MRAHFLNLEIAPRLILLASILVLGTALASQYWGGLVPCELCLYQRWPYGITIGLAVLALFIPGLRIPLILLSGLVFLAGGGIAFFHVGVEQGFFEGPSSCSGAPIDAQSIEELKRLLEAAPIVRCDEVAWSLFGISMAGFNLIASVILAVGCALAAFGPRKRAT